MPYKKWLCLGYTHSQIERRGRWGGKNKMLKKTEKSKKWNENENIQEAKGI